MSASAKENEADNSAVASSSNRNLLKGMKIRDEFLCPITCDLLREPVVASDGNTYEKTAIEKWLKSNQTSPRTGEPLESTIIVPNLNLKKLIQDILNEGGAGFYMNDISNRDRLVEVCPEKILILECLGPPESEWNQQSFQVTHMGCIGGRRHNVDDHSKEVILFKDITVSRKHFEITQSIDAIRGITYSIRDLGSAGGTFIRILFGSKKELHIGMIILLGKHQFTVSSIDDSGNGADDEEQRLAARRNSLTRRSGPPVTGARKSSLNSDILKTLVKNAEMIIEDISKESSGISAEDRLQKDELSNKLKSLTVELSCHLGIDAIAERFGGDAKQNALDAKAAFQHGTAMGMTTNDLDISADAKDDIGGLSPSPSKAVLADMKSLQTVAEEKEEFSASDKKDDDDDRPAASRSRNYDFSTRRLTLTCCAPDGSPLQGKNFIVGPEGATIGRKATNSIPLLTKMETNGEEKLCSVDTSISSEHARVEFDSTSGRFFVSDGTTSKSSTNGTWFRLSGPHQESPPHSLKNGTEVLIGTVRFLVKESMTILERRVDEK